MKWSVSLRSPRPSFLAHGIPVIAAIWAVVVAFVLSHAQTLFFAVFCCGLGVAGSALVLLLQHWSVDAAALCNTVACSRVEDASLVLVRPPPHKGSPGFAPIQRNEKTAFFEFQQKRFVWSGDRFEKASFPRLSASELRAVGENKGLKDDGTALAIRQQYGSNSLSLPVPTFRELYKEHSLAPFFVLQIFFVLLWCLDQYWMYAIVTGVMLGLLEAVTVWKRLKTIRFLRSMIQSAGDVSVCRGGKWVKHPSSDLVPGDLFQVTMGVIPCDAALVAGACVVNESTLTGENVALLKDAVMASADEEKGEKGEKALEMEGADRTHVLFGGTRVIQLQSSSVRAVVLRTGFASSQGRVLRTIAFASQPVSANSMEALAFVVFLLLFAVVAAGYVLVDGLGREDKSPYKLLLQCIIILTSVVPPELPIELALAVTASLAALKVLRVFCTEPFRIPLAGKLDVCAFDKTGTLTCDDLIFRGVTVKDSAELETAGKNIPDAALFVVAGCQSLSRVEGRVIGDPLETAVFEKVGWKLSSDHNESGHTSKKFGCQIVFRYQFSAALRRMTTVAVVSGHGTRPEYRVCVKGAPEVVRELLRMEDRSEVFDSVYRQYAQKGFRVIALASKTFAEYSDSANHSRETLEKDLTFNGFLVFECLLREGTSAVLAQLERAGMVNMMITGDSELTAIAVAEQTKMTSKPALVLSKDGVWESAFSKESFPFSESGMRSLRKTHTLCVLGGPSLALLSPSLYVYVSVFARCSPADKEQILVGLRSRYHTLMCGDGTNDVGALKQAHVGIALVFNDEPPPVAVAAPVAASAPVKKALAGKGAASVPAPAPATPVERVTGIRFVDKMLHAMDGPGAASSGGGGGNEDVMNMGDASIAAPFTVRSRNVAPVLDVCRQGRCTLVTTMSMYFILALNGLITAFSLSALHLQGVHMGDAQMTVTALLTTFAFFFISRATPLSTLSASKPKSRIFSPYFMTSLLGQFAVHLSSLLAAVHFARESPGFVAPTGDDFVPSAINSCVFLISLSMQISAFVVNYQGHPFMQSLAENKGLRSTLLFGYVIAGSSLLGVLNTALGLTPLDAKLRMAMAVIVVADAGGAFLAEKIASLFFSKHGSPISLL